MTFEIRRARVSDLPQLSDICSRTFIETYEGKGANRTTEMVLEYVKEKFNENALLKELETPHLETWMALQENTAAGYLKIVQEAPPDFVSEKNLIHLERIYVLKEYHGKGAGKALLAKAEDRTKNLKHNGLWLGVWEENTHAIEFYLGNGFTKAGIHTWEFDYLGVEYRDIDNIMIKLFGN